MGCHGTCRDQSSDTQEPEGGRVCMGARLGVTWGKELGT